MQGMDAALKRRELWVAPLCEALLILIAGVATWVTRQPLVFTSLGPTAYELIETPERRSSEPYSVIVGHLVGVLSGFAALGITQAWRLPPVPSGPISGERVAAVTLAAMLTVLGTMVVHAQQPAAISTSLLVSLGTMQRPRDAVFIMAAVILIVLTAEPVRRWRIRSRRALQRREDSSSRPQPASEG